MNHIVKAGFVGGGVYILAFFTSSYFSFATQLLAATCTVLGLMFFTYKRKPSIKIMNFDISSNPLKGKPKTSLETLDPDIIRKVNSEIAKFSTYDATKTASLERFLTIQQNTECIFAKKAKLWGSTGWIQDLSVQDNVEKFLPTFLKFTLLCEHLGLDGFVIELPECYATDIKVFGNTVRDVLKAISSRDPFENNSMSKSYIDRLSWVYRFHRETFFITTFAHFYPETNSRFSFCNKKGYILLQPEISFAQYDIPPDTERTNWDEPVTVRDKIRIAFRKAGRGYKAMKGRPLIHDIVKPLDEGTDFIEWWKDNS